MENSHVLQIISDLTALSPRQGVNEQKAARYITEQLETVGISYTVQEFETTIPRYRTAVLFADGQPIDCEGCCFVSGKITSKDNIVSSLISSQPLITTSNINFNPACANDISISNHYFAPSLAIKREDVSRIILAKKICGEVDVEKKVYTSANILVGNCGNPKNILIAHYDCLKIGVTDNASGVAVLLELLLSNPSLTQNNLFIFAGNEELSFDQPVYWGHGFRVFEEEYLSAMKQAEKIFVVDCVGNGKPVIFQDERITKLAFPIKNIDQLSSKIYNVAGDIEKLMTVYHSDNDTIDQLSEKYLSQTIEALQSVLNI